MKLGQLGRGLTIFAAFSLSGNPGALARQPLETQPAPGVASTALQMAQAATNCRVPNRLSDVFSRPSVAADSNTLATLQANTPVYLERDPNGGFFQENGFVRGSIPSANNVTGYLIARHLTSIPNCGSGTTPPPQPQATCARVTVADLTVRQNPAETAAPTGRVVTSGQVVRIRDDEVERATGRVWVQIPVDNITGWIAETGRSGLGRNLSARYPCPQAAVSNPVSYAPPEADPESPVPPNSDPANESELPLVLQNAVLQATRLNTERPNIWIVRYEEELWPDGCLGLGGASDSCAASVVPGWQVVTTDGAKSWIFRTDQEEEVRLESVADL